jgi:hypothetical protein
MTPATGTLRQNWRLKVSALGLAVLLWTLVQSEPRSEETFSSVPVVVEVFDTAWTSSGPPSPATVELRLGGPAREIIRLAREGTSVRVPVGTVGSPDTVIAVRRDWVVLGAGSGLFVESVSPSNIQVSFEPALTRLVPVSMRVQGRVREGLALATEVGVSPQLVRVRGPESRVLGLDSVPLHPFDLGAVTASGVYTVAIDTAGLGGASVIPAMATLGVRVEDLVERVLEGLVVRTDAAPGEPGVVPDPATVRLTLSGARSLVTSLDPTLLSVWVPTEFLEGMAPGEQRRVRLLVGGVPELLTALPGTEYVTVRRASDVPRRNGGRQQP